ncbi:PIN-like domain-containing protein [Actinoplanes teichomyceticus]|nr:PIN-like domain-containing protein [Actinoplanes teichomyceticus]GIF12659.1 hypothetical protein Ate01nite_26910 [Actinoplanes teichomyceticus]
MTSVTGERTEFRSMFPGWLGQQSIQDNYFKSGLFVPDANILLGCYRIGPAAREQLLSTLENHQDRLWVPHQSALEFARNRDKVLPDQKKRHSETKKQVSDSLNKAIRAISDAVETLTDYRAKYLAEAEWHAAQHGLAKDDIKTRLTDMLSPVTDELSAIQGGHDVTVRDFADASTDLILARLSTILDGKVGPRYDAARVRQIVQETVEYRFPNQIPPGYRDAENKNALGAAGDVILWYQVLDRLRYGEGDFTKVVWITTDVKEDLWVLDDKDRHPVRARPELVQEMYDETGAELLMVTLHDFLTGAKTFLNADISDETLEQAEGLSTAPPDNIGLLTHRLLQGLDNIFDRLGIDQLATLVARLYARAGYEVADLQVRESGADMVVHRGGQKTAIAVRTSGHNMHTALAGLVVAADALPATHKVMIYTGSYTPLELKLGGSLGVEMRDLTDLADLVDGQDELPL